VEDLTFNLGREGRFMGIFVFLDDFFLSMIIAGRPRILFWLFWVRICFYRNDIL
jgi:hypothetical protein